MKKRAMVDRFEDKQAVLLIDEKPMVVIRSILPKDTKEGAWLEVEIEEGRVLSAKIDLFETEQSAKRIAEKLSKLRKGNYLK